MGLFGGLLNLAVDVVKMPVSVIKDVVNLGDTDKTSENADDLGDDLEDIFDGDLL